MESYKITMRGVQKFNTCLRTNKLYKKKNIQPTLNGIHVCPHCRQSKLRFSNVVNALRINLCVARCHACIKLVSYHNKRARMLLWKSKRG